MANLVEFAEIELNKLLKTCTDSETLKMQKEINDNVMNILRIFSDQNLSPESTAQIISLLRRITKWKPILPLTGDDNEWEEIDVDGDKYCKNKRCPTVFKNNKGNAYDMEGKIFTVDNGYTWFTSSFSNVNVDFPYDVPDIPDQVYLYVEEREKIESEIKELIKNAGGNTDYENETVISSLFDDETKLDKFENILKEKYKFNDDDLKEFSFNDTMNKVITVVLLEYIDKYGIKGVQDESTRD